MTVGAGGCGVTWRLFWELLVRHV